LNLDAPSARTQTAENRRLTRRAPLARLESEHGIVPGMPKRDH